MEDNIGKTRQNSIDEVAGSIQATSTIGPAITANSKRRLLNAPNLVVAIIITMSLYLLIAPVVPAVEYYLRDVADVQYKNRANDSGGEYELALQGRKEESDYFKDDIVLIPSIGVDMDVVEGQSDDALDKGAWIRPNGSKPNLGSNTVITAHRFSYLDGGRSFYNLDKVKNGDEVIVYWKGDRYRYIVNGSRVVKPSAVQIENPTNAPMLTLYTCTPLWTAANRLVITAVPDEPTLNLITERASL